MNKWMFFIVAAAAALLVGRTASAISYTFDNLNCTIPDGSPVGMADTRPVVAPFTSIGDVDVTLNILSRGGAAFDGDLYVYLRHGSGLAVLLNRVGRTAADELGYSDNGFSVTLDDEAASNVHTYRLSLFGNSNMRLSGALTGSWQPDGRFVDPDLVLAGDLPTTDASLSSFDGMDPNGDWTLFIADMEGGNKAQLASWRLDITAAGPQPVPEPLSTCLFAGLVFAAMLTIDSRRRRLGRWRR